MNIVVTGCSGFIGKNLTSHLLSNGHHVLGIDLLENDVTKEFSLLSNFKFIKSNLSELCLNIGSIEMDYDCVIHLAWKGVSPDFRNNYSHQISNITDLDSLIRFLKMIKVKKLITVGSTMEYLSNNQLIGDRPFPTPSNLYGAIKVASRYILEQLCVINDIEFVYAISTSVYGVGRNDNNIINYTINKLLKNEIPDLTDLTQEWDFIHIRDLVDGLYLLCRNETNGQVYAIGNGDNFQLKYYIELIRDIINPDLKLGIGNVKNFNLKVTSSKIDNSLIKKLGFKQNVKFEQGIKEIIESINKENHTSGDEE